MTRTAQSIAALIAGALLLTSSPAAAKASFTVRGETFVLSQPGSKTLTSRDLVGAIFEGRTPDGVQASIRIDSVTPSKEQPYILLHAFSYKDKRGNWTPLCDKDYYGRRAGFPIEGTFNGNRFIPDKSKWFLTCTSGSQGKCILWGYDPWKRGPHGESLVPYYEACQHVVRADYDGKGVAHTKNGTKINVWDHIGIQLRDKLKGARFEAGWGPDGAVCVGKTRWADLITLAALQKSDPALAGPCNEKIATAKGALIFNQSL